MQLSKLEVPSEIRDAVEPIKGDDEAIREYGIRQCTELCQKLLEAGVRLLVLYTLACMCRAIDKTHEFN